MLHHEEAVAFEDAFVGDAYGGRVDATLLVSLGYHLRDGLWWQPDAVVRHSTFAEFSLPVGTSRADGAETSVEHDPHYLVATGFTDALGNQLSAEIDYQRLAPWRISDPNGSVREVRYDPLGVVVAATHYGHVGTAPWGFAPVSSLAYDQPVALDNVIAAADSSPQGVQDQTWYDLDAWSSSAQPTAVVSLLREQYVDDGAGGHGDDLVHVGVTYLDAFGRVLPAKGARRGRARHRARCRGEHRDRCRRPAGARRIQPEVAGIRARRLRQQAEADPGLRALLHHPGEL